MEPIAEASAALQALLDASPEACFLLDPAGTILAANEETAARLGRALPDILGACIYDLLPAEVAQRRRVRVAEVLRTGQPRRFVDQRAGRTIHNHIYPVRDAAGQVSGLAIVGVDITEHREAAAALRESEARFRALVESSADHIFMLNRAGVYLMSNARMGHFGLHEGESLVGRALEEVYPPEVAAFYRRQLEEVLATGRPLEFEHPLEESDGLHQHLDTLYPVRRDGRLWAVGGICRDITALKQAENELKDAYARLEALWSVSSLVDADAQTISDHILASINRMTGSRYGFYGFVNQDETTMTVYSWTGEAMRDCLMDNKPQCFPLAEADVWGEAVRRRQVLILNDYAAPHPAKKGLPPGHVPLTNLLVVPFFAHGRITVVAAVANRPTGYTEDDATQITAFLGSIQAIVEHKLAEEELRRAEEKYRTVADFTYDWEYWLGPDGCYLYVSPSCERITGYRAEAFMRDPGLLERIVHPDDRALVAEHMERALHDEGDHVFDFRLVTRAGQECWVAHRCQAVYGADGRFLGQRGSNRDVTERKLQEAARELTTRLVALINTPGSFRTCMQDLTGSLQGWSGCEAIGIRLRAGDDFPYYETRGFPAEFVEAESTLCTLDPDGNIARDNAGNPVLECMCGNVLAGRFDPGKPFFTAHGSFWTNSTTALLASTTEADRQARTRNRCNGEGYESVALIPLRVGTQVFGLLQFNDPRPGRFTPTLIANLERLADSLALALSRRQAEEVLRTSRQRLQQLTRQLVSTQEEERRRLSRELHDEAGQALTALKINLELLRDDLPAGGAPRLNGAIALTDATMEQIRQLAHDLRPPALDAVGLNLTLEEFCHDFAARTGLDIGYNAAAVPPLPDAAGLALYRFLQETLTNVARHARAQQARVALDFDGAAVSLVVQDDGQGIARDALAEAVGPSRGIGLLGLRERLETLGGRLEVASKPGQGTCVTAVLPYEEVA